MPTNSHKKKPHAKLQLSVAPGILEEVMDFLKSAEEDAALAALGKHARSIMQKYAKGKRMTYWGVLDAYALFCLTECKLMIKGEWDKAIADFETFEKWQQTHSKLTHSQLLVLNRFPSILQFILQQESRRTLRSDLPKITESYVLDQYNMLKRLLKDSFDVLQLSEMEEKDDNLAEMVKEIVRDTRSKSSAKVVQRLSKHMGDVFKFIDDSIKLLEDAHASPALAGVVVTPKAAQEAEEDKKETPEPEVKEQKSAPQPETEKSKKKHKKHKKHAPTSSPPIKQETSSSH